MAPRCARSTGTGTSCGSTCAPCCGRRAARRGVSRRRDRAGRRAGSRRQGRGAGLRNRVEGSRCGRAGLRHRASQPRCPDAGCRHLDDLGRTHRRTGNRRARKPRHSPVTVGLSAPAVVLLAAAGCFAFQAHRSTTSGPAANTAFSDSAATSAITGQLSAASEASRFLPGPPGRRQNPTGRRAIPRRQRRHPVPPVALGRPATGRPPPPHPHQPRRHHRHQGHHRHDRPRPRLRRPDDLPRRHPDTSNGGAQVRLTATDDNGRWRVSDIAVL